MSHVTIEDVAKTVTVQPGAVVSKVIHRDADVDVTVFAFDAGEGITQHTASRPAIVQVLAGRLRFTTEGEDLNAVPGTWIYLSAGAPHTIAAVEPTVMLLTLLRPER
ncbi:MAG: cupin domain-containing protein [Chloroflexi bacterium]|nr:cupin domain-containing protein [Chloroflexota bacterium]